MNIEQYDWQTITDTCGHNYQISAALLTYKIEYGLACPVCEPHGIEGLLGMLLDELGDEVTLTGKQIQEFIRDMKTHPNDPHEDWVWTYAELLRDEAEDMRSAPPAEEINRSVRFALENPDDPMHRDYLKLISQKYFVPVEQLLYTTFVD